MNEIQCTMTTRQAGTCRPGRRPAIQGPRPQLRNRGWVDKSATGINRGKKLKVATDLRKTGTWNVQTLRSPGKLEVLRNEINVKNLKFHSIVSHMNRRTTLIKRQISLLCRRYFWTASTGYTLNDFSNKIIEPAAEIPSY